MSPHPSSQEDPIYIECEAPEGYPGANFTLYQGEHVVQLLQAPADQFKVTFNLSGGSRDPSGGPFNCQYGVLGEHMRPQLSEHSDTVDIPPGKALPGGPAAPGPIFSPPSLCTCCSSRLEVVTGQARLPTGQDVLIFPCLIVTVIQCDGYSKCPHFVSGETEAQGMKGPAKVTQLAGGRAGVPWASKIRH